MTHTELTQMYIATCLCCLLASNMKVCPLCLFRIGLKVKDEQAKHSETKLESD